MKVGFSTAEDVADSTAEETDEEASLRSSATSALTTAADRRAVATTAKRIVALICLLSGRGLHNAKEVERFSFRWIGRRRVGLF